MKKIIITTAVIFFSMAGIADAAPDSNSIIRNGIEYYMQTDKAVYDLGEDVVMLYRVTNLGDEDVFFEFSTNKQYHFSVESGGELIWEMDRDAAMIVTYFALQPTEFIEFSETWNQVDNDGIPVEPGNYQVIGELGYPFQSNQYVPVSVPIEIIPEPAMTYYVDATEGSDDNDGLSPQTAFATIQKAIDSALDGDTVLVADGRYTGPGNQDIDFLGKAITVRSESGPENCIIDCNGTEDDPHRGFYFHNDEDTNSVLAGFTIMHGYGPTELIGRLRRSRGGAILFFGAGPTITDCIITENSAGWVGGAMACYYSNPTITQCTIANNSSDEYGGAIFCSHSSPTLVNCIISHNNTDPQWSYGGALSCWYDSAPIITDCIINGNSAQYGGGIECHKSRPNISTCTITGNSAAVGGGMYNWGSSPKLSNCTFSGNSAYSGGAMKNSGGISTSDPTLINCIFSGNSAVDDGGGMSNYNNSNITITNCTFTANSAPNGNALAFDSWQQQYPSNIQVTNCILADGGYEIWNNDGSTITITYSDVQGGYEGQGNINADPCFVEPGYWADANDPNIVVEPNDPNAIWVDGDYHLKSFGWRWDTQRKIWTWDDVTSRCIDAGNPGSPVGEELLSVPVDPNNEWGQNLRINIGAYGGTAEASMPPYDWALLADLTNDGTVNFEDYAAQAIDWLESESEQPGDLNRDGTVDIADIALLTEDWLEQTSWYVP